MKVGGIIAVAALVVSVKIANSPSQPIQDTHIGPKIGPTTVNTVPTTVGPRTTVVPYVPTTFPPAPSNYPGNNPTMPGVVGWKEVLV